MATEWLRVFRREADRARLGRGGPQVRGPRGRENAPRVGKRGRRQWRASWDFLAAADLVNETARIIEAMPGRLVSPVMVGAPTNWPPSPTDSIGRRGPRFHVVARRRGRSRQEPPGRGGHGPRPGRRAGRCAAACVNIGAAGRALRAHRRGALRELHRELSHGGPRCAGRGLRCRPGSTPAGLRQARAARADGPEPVA